MSMPLFVNGNDFGECLACDIDFAHRTISVITCDSTISQSGKRLDIFEADKLAREIADESAASAVNSCSLEADGHPGWREIGAEYFNGLEDYLKYLELRGLVERDALNVRLVRLAEVEE
jgi:hypothetical protein